MHPTEHEIHQRLVGLMQLSGCTDAAVAASLSTSPAAVNAWRRRGRLARAAVPSLRVLLTAHIGKPIDAQGHLLGDGSRPILDHTERRRAVEDTGCHAPASRSHTWHTQRDVTIALASLGSTDAAIARAIGEPCSSVACWLRMARVPNERMADVASKIPIARDAGSGGSHLFAGAGLEDDSYRQAVDDAAINERFNRLIEASGLEQQALADRIPARITTVVGWRQRRRVPARWRSRLADALSPVLGITIRADGLVSDGRGGWVEWGERCPGDAHASPAHLSEIPGIRDWLDARIDSLADAPVTQARRETLHQQAVAAMAVAADAVVAAPVDTKIARPVRARQKRRRGRFTTT